MNEEKTFTSINIKAFQEYFKEVKYRIQTGDSTEITLRTPFENFIKSIDKQFILIQEPKRIEKVGAPDFKAYRKDVKIGYIETKDLGKNLDEELESNQIKKYKNSIDNLILTNYGRFILIRGTKTFYDVNLFTLSDFKQDKYSIQKDTIKKFEDLLKTFFFEWKLPTISSAKELATILSRKAKLLKELAKEQLIEDLYKISTGEQTSSVYDFYEGTKEIIRDIAMDDCADAYAQTITYGLFLARINSPSIINRDNAASYIPRSIGIIRRIFINIAGDSLPSNLSWIIDEIIDVLNASIMKKVLSEIDSRGKTDRDPFTFFYEDFLSAYDPEKRKHLGVYYTPRPVVSFIVNSINIMLQKEFNKPHGLADDDVTVLDPAVGTGTFLWLVYTLSLVELKNKGLGGLINNKIKNHILKDFYGLEILITPYIIAHLKLSLILKKWLYDLKDNDRNQVYLTNTLEPFESHGLLPFLREISEESKTANELKLRKKILVITSNPPYRGMSVNRGEWIESLLKKGYNKIDGSRDDGYYQIDGKPLEEKNPKWLQDDYVKFIRFAQWKIDVAGEGIIGFITNHNYLNNTTFRGMRKSLINSFDKIYILNLHGSSLKKEKSPDGSQDENVFDIRPGVAIAIFIKKSTNKDKRIFYAESYGKREEKFHWLDKHNIINVNWREVKPVSPYYFFIPENSTLRVEYEKYWKISDIFLTNNIGIVTARDNLTIKWSSEEIWQTITKIITNSSESTRAIFNLGKDSIDWKIDWARKDIEKSGPNIKQITPILYRPFDDRYTYYTGKSSGFHCRPRPETMSHMLQGNLGLIFHRREELAVPYSHFLITDKIVEHGALSSKTTCYLAPLYIYKNNSRSSNINPRLIFELTSKYGNKPSEEEIIYYIYAVAYSNNYRERYSDFLKNDFPHIPFTKEYKIFKQLVEIGEKLVNLHLLKIKLKSTVKFEVQGSNSVEFIKYYDNKIYINKKQNFDGISERAWSFYLGGYQVLDKWLKSRKDRELTSGEIEHFMQIIEIINQTINLMKKIDEIKFL